MLLKIFFLILLNINLIPSEDNSLDDYKDVDPISVRKDDTKTKRDYVQTPQELALTKSDPVIDNEPCANQQPVSILIHSVGRSDPKDKYYKRRVAQRETWVSEAKGQNISIYFVIALNADQKVNQELKEESDKYQDMIQMNFIDHYWNLTLKAISILRWTQRMCRNNKFILKVDDDVVINIPLLLKHSNDFTHGLYGSPVTSKMIDKSDHYWHIPPKYKPPVLLDQHMRGFAYVMTTDIIDKLVEGVDTSPHYVLEIDDLMITGYIAKRAGIPLISNHWFKCEKSPNQPNDKYRDFDVITFCEFGSGDELIEFYSKFNGTYPSSSTKLLVNWFLSIVLIICLII